MSIVILRIIRLATFFSYTQNAISSSNNEQFTHLNHPVIDYEAGFLVHRGQHQFKASRLALLQSFPLIINPKLFLQAAMVVIIRQEIKTIQLLHNCLSITVIHMHQIIHGK